MGKRKVGKPSANLKTLQAPSEEPEELSRAPHSFVIHRGTIGKHIMALMKDFRKVMEPFTASSLKVKKKNTIKDFVSISTMLHVSHMTVFTITDVSPYMRIARLPQGPTLTFKIHDYALARDVVSSLRRQYSHSKAFMNSPLIILNGFSGEGSQLKLMSTMFQSMFPTLNIAKLNLNTIRRCILLNYNEETKSIDFRHYVIRVTPTGLNKGVKKLVMGKLPNLAKYTDVSDFVFKDDLLSDASEAEDEGGQIVLPQKMASKGNYVNNTSAIRLSELGPRLTLQLVKVEGGLMDGEVMFHEFVHKTEEEVELLKKQRRIKRRLKETRRREQERNVQRKEEEKAQHKEMCLEGMTKSLSEGEIEVAPQEQQVVEAPEYNTKQEEDEDDDAEWYRKEVGREPEPELFSGMGRGAKRHGGPFNKRGPFKRGRFNQGEGERSQDGRGRSGGVGSSMGSGRFQEGRGGGRGGRGGRGGPGGRGGRGGRGEHGGNTSMFGFSNRDGYNDRSSGGERGKFRGKLGGGGFSDRRGGYSDRRGGGRSDRRGGYSDRRGGGRSDRRGGGRSDRRGGGRSDRRGGYSDRRGGHSDRRGGHAGSRGGHSNRRGGCSNRRGSSRN